MNKNLIIGILEYPIFLIAGVMINCLHDLIIQPIYMSRLRARGISVFDEIDPKWNYFQIKEKFASVGIPASEEER